MKKYRSWDLASLTKKTLKGRAFGLFLVEEWEADRLLAVFDTEEKAAEFQKYLEGITILKEDEEIVIQEIPAPL